MMGKIMKRNDFGKIVNYTMKGNNKSKLLAIEVYVQTANSI